MANTVAAPLSSAAAHRLAALVDGTVVQRAIAPVAVPGTLADMRVMQNLQPNDPVLEMGLTDPPANADAPNYTITTATDGNAVVSARLAKTQGPVEGDVRSVYVGPGTYASNYRWKPDSKVLEEGGVLATVPGEQRSVTPGQYLNMVNWDHLYVVVSNVIANLSQQAEDEHLNDIRHAYALTLGAANGALDGVIAGMPPNGFVNSLANAAYADPAAATTDVRARIVAALPVASVTLGFDRAHWLAEYLRLAAKTQLRDQQNWHTFGLNSKQFVWNGKAYKTLAMLGNFVAWQGPHATHYADVAQRPHMQIGVTPSANQIVF